MLILTDKQTKTIYGSKPSIFQAKLFARHFGVKTRGKSYSEQWLFKQIAGMDPGKKSDWKALPFTVLIFPGGKKLFTFSDQISERPGGLIQPVRLDGLMTLAEAGYRWYNGNDANVRNIMLRKPPDEWHFETVELAGTTFVRHR